MAKGLNWEKNKMNHALGLHREPPLPPPARPPSVAEIIRAGVMPWGKHKGRRLSAIPPHYLKWLYGVRPEGCALRKAIGTELFRRHQQERADQQLRDSSDAQKRS
jgi:hypothetical protein